MSRRKFPRHTQEMAATDRLTPRFADWYESIKQRASLSAESAVDRVAYEATRRKEDSEYRQFPDPPPPNASTRSRSSPPPTAMSRADTDGSTAPNLT